MRRVASPLIHTALVLHRRPRPRPGHIESMSSAARTHALLNSLCRSSLEAARILLTPCSPPAQAAEHAFGPYKIRQSEVFAESPLALAFVNLKPVVPGHVLLIPRRVVGRLAELRPAELQEMWVRTHLKIIKLINDFREI